MAVYATPDELQSFLPSGAQAQVADVDRLLARASAKVDGMVRACYDVDDNGAPTDADVAAALRDATCAQVEQWIEVGEANDIDGLAGTQRSVGGASGLRAPSRAPRALEILSTAGLLTVPDGAGW